MSQSQPFWKLPGRTEKDDAELLEITEGFEQIRTREAELRQRFLALKARIEETQLVNAA